MECFGTYQARKITREESNDGFENVGKVSGIKKDVQGIKNLKPLYNYERNFGWKVRSIVV